MTDLTEIDGVGPAYAEELEESGYETAEQVASADAADIDNVLASADGEELVSAAKEEIAEEIPEEDETSESDESDASESNLITFEPDFSENQRNHLIAAVIDREIVARRTNQKDDVDNIKSMINELIGDEPYELTLQQISTAYTAVNQHEDKLRSQRGIGGFVSEIREVQDELQDLRTQNWPK